MPEDRQILGELAEDFRQGAGVAGHTVEASPHHDEHGNDRILRFGAGGKTAAFHHRAEKFELVRLLDHAGMSVTVLPQRAQGDREVSRDVRSVCLGEPIAQLMEHGGDDCASLGRHRGAGDRPPDG